MKENSSVKKGSGTLEAPASIASRPLPESSRPLFQNQSAVDELNLAEFPLAAISDRFLDGTKTVVLEDTVFDREQNKYLPRRLTLSGSDRYGLPTSKDDDVLLACIQLSRLNDFATREVSFSRYEILRLLGWADESRNYERVAMSPSEQDAFETEALEAADTMKKRLYLEASGKGGKAFEIYRQMVLMDQFERTHGMEVLDLS